MPSISKMNSRIVVQKRNIQYVKGKADINWEDYYSCWCEVLDLYGKEKYDAYAAKLENSLKFKCRSCKKLSDILFETREYRVIWKGKEFNIMFVDTLGDSKVDIILQVQVVS